MKLSLFFFALAVLCSSVLRATTLPVYSNFDAQHPYNPAFGLTVQQAVAVPFITPATGVPGFAFALSDLEFVAVTTGTDPAALVLYDTSGGFPGTALESFQPAINSQPGVVTVTSSTHPLLISGQEYWSVLSESVPYEVTWNADGNGAVGPASLTAGFR